MCMRMDQGLQFSNVKSVRVEVPSTFNMVIILIAHGTRKEENFFNNRFPCSDKVGGFRTLMTNIGFSGQ